MGAPMIYCKSERLFKVFNNEKLDQYFSALSQETNIKHLNPLSFMSIVLQE